MPRKCRSLAVDHVDMMFHVLCQLGYGIGLDAAAKGMDLVGKKEGMTGALAPRFWAQGRRKEILDYVAHDVQITLELAEICEARGFLRWITRSGRSRKFPLLRGWLSVRQADRLPEPGNTFWMCSHWSRTRSTAWLW